MYISYVLEVRTLRNCQ